MITVIFLEIVHIRNINLENEMNPIDTTELFIYDKLC